MQGQRGELASTDVRGWWPGRHGHPDEEAPAGSWDPGKRSCLMAVETSGVTRHFQGYCWRQGERKRQRHREGEKQREEEVEREIQIHFRKKERVLVIFLIEV